MMVYSRTSYVPIVSRTSGYVVRVYGTASGSASNVKHIRAVASRYDRSHSSSLLALPTAHIYRHQVFCQSGFASPCSGKPPKGKQMCCNGYRRRDWMAFFDSGDPPWAQPPSPLLVEDLPRPMEYCIGRIQSQDRSCILCVAYICLMREAGGIQPRTHHSSRLSVLASLASSSI
jgi:hypothetical protein